MGFDRTNGDKVADAIDARIQKVAQEVYSRSPSNRTVYGKVVSVDRGLFTVEINMHTYTKVPALRNSGVISKNETVICLIPNNEYGNMVILGVADGSTETSGGFPTSYVSSIDGQTGAVTGIPRYVEDSSTTSSISVLLNTIYPVGSVRLSINAGETSFMGGTWVLVSEGRALFGAGTLNGNTYTADGTKDAGLPNITGTQQLCWNDNSGGGIVLGPEGTGAFYKSNVGTARFSSASATGSQANAINIDASRSSPIYGNSTTVQPNAYVVYVYKRTA